MSIKDKLSQIDSNLAEHRAEYERRQREVVELKATLQRKEEECRKAEEVLKKTKDSAEIIVEELIRQAKLLEERETLYHNATESGAFKDEILRVDKATILLYDSRLHLRTSLEEDYQAAMWRKKQRSDLKKKVTLEMLVAKEKSGAQVNTAIIAPIETKKYKTYFHSKNPEEPGEFMELLLEWVGVNLVKAKVQPQSGEYQGFFKATIPGTPELQFDSELPDEFKEANIGVEAVILREEEFLLGGEQPVAVALPVNVIPEVGEYTLSTGKKVDASKTYTTSKVAALLGYAGDSSIRYIVEHGAEREQKGLPRLAAEEHYPEGDHTRRRTLMISGQSIIDFDEKRSGKSRVAVPPAQSVDEVVDEVVVQPSVLESGVERKVGATTIVVPVQDTFTIAEIAMVLGMGYGCAGELVKQHPHSEEWKVPGKSKTGYVYKNIPRAVVVELAERYASRSGKKVSTVTSNQNLMGVVEASRYIAAQLKECGVEYALSSIGMGVPAKTYARKHLNHQPGLKLPAERGERNQILVRRDGLDDFVDKYVKEEIIKPKVKAGKTYEEITAGLPEKYHGSVRTFLAHLGHGDYKRGRGKAKGPATSPLEAAVEGGAEAKTVEAEDRDYYTTSEAAAIVGVSSRMIQNYITERKITAEKRDPHNLRCAWRISKASLDEYLVQIGKKAAPAEPVITPTAPVPQPVPPAEAQPPAPTAVSPQPSLPERELADKVYLLITYTGLDEKAAEAFLPNLDPDGGVERIDALEKALVRLVKNESTIAATKILSAKPEMLTTRFDYWGYYPKLCSTLESIFAEHFGEIPDYYNPLQSPQNFTSVGSLEQVERALNKAISRREREVRLKATASDKEYYHRYPAQIIAEVATAGYNFGMVCAIIEHGLNAETRKPFGTRKTMTGDVLKKKVSGFYGGGFNLREYDRTISKLVQCGAMLEQRGSGQFMYSMPTALPDSVPAPLIKLLQPLYASTNK